MSNELSIQSEVLAMQYRAELAEVKLELMKQQAQKLTRLEDSLLAPDKYEHYHKVAERYARSGLVPKAYENKPEDVFVAMAMGYQLGFPLEQSLQDIAVINGRPCLWGDGLLSVCLSHPQCESINEEPIVKDGSVIGYKCSVKRKGHDLHTQVFTLKDAQQAGLIGRSPVWKNYPARMLQMRARSLALRDKFADALRGLRVAEIEQDDARVIDGQFESVSEAKTTVDKLKEVFNKKEINNDDGDTSDNNDVLDGQNGSLLEDKIDKIEILMEEQGFTEERISKAFKYFDINCLQELTDEQADLFLIQLGKGK